MHADLMLKNLDQIFFPGICDEKKKQHSFDVKNFCNNISVFTVTFEQFIWFVLHSFNTFTHTKLLNSSVQN